MAYEAKFDNVVPYCNVTLEEVRALTRDTIFSRRPEGIKRTGIFIGGRDFDLAVAMLASVRQAMVPPFEVSAFADPSGAFTTAAAMVAIAEHLLRARFAEDLAGARVCVLGGTGPVGICAAILASRCGAEVSIVSRSSAAKAQHVADHCRRRHQAQLRGADGSNPEAVAGLVADAQVILNTAKAGARVIDSATLVRAGSLRVAVDANPVPPGGIEGIGSDDDGVDIETAFGNSVGVGALVVGDAKYRIHTRLLQTMSESPTPVYLGYEEAFTLARQILSE
jgi:methylene-tetrahydromethanopterin dehydrogenase